MEQQTFFDKLRDSGLLAADKIAEVRRRLEDAPTQALTSALVQEGVLTSFQAQQIVAGQGKGLVLGQYQILEELGRGGYGCVYKARHRLMERVVALKVIAPELIEDERIHSWFRREVLAATQLHHPNIVMAYDADEVDSILFFAMEYIDGPSLDVLVRRQGPLAIGLACELLQQTARALHYAHEKGMVHRDIKPANLLIPRAALAEFLSGEAISLSPRPPLVKVVDFGLARFRGQENGATLVLQNEKSFVGTPDYVSPEQARNVHNVDIRSDLYSLGCTFYFALSGQRPFKASSLAEVILQHLEKEAMPLDQLRPDIPLPLAGIIRRMMAKKPEKRFQSPAELLEELGLFGLGNGPRETFASARPQPAEADPRAEEKTCVTPLPDLPTKAPFPPLVNNPESLPHPSLNSGSTGVSTVDLVDNPASKAQIAPVPAFALAPSLARSWQQWAGLVENLVQGKTLNITEAAYRQLHHDLLAECRAHAGRHAAADREFFLGLENLVQPWLTPRTLAAMDPQTLANLQQRCCHISRELGLARGIAWTWVLGLFTAFVAAGLGWFFLKGQMALPSLASLWRFLEKNPLLSLACVVPALVLASLFFFSRLFRS